MVRMRSPVRLRLKAPQKKAPFRGSFFYGKIEKTNRTIRKERMRSTVEEKQPQNRELQGARSPEKRSVRGTRASKGREATRQTEGYPTAKRIHGKDEVRFDSG